MKILHVSYRMFVRGKLAPVANRETFEDVHEFIKWLWINQPLAVESISIVETSGPGK